MRHAISVMIRRAFFADKIRVGPIIGVRCEDSFEGVSTKLYSRMFLALRVAAYSSRSHCFKAAVSAKLVDGIEFGPINS